MRRCVQERKGDRLMEDEEVWFTVGDGAREERYWKRMQNRMRGPLIDTRSLAWIALFLAAVALLIGVAVGLYVNNLKVEVHNLRHEIERKK